MTRLSRRPHRPVRTDLLARTALCGALAGALGVLLAPRASALPVEAPVQLATPAAGGAAASPSVNVSGQTETVTTHASRSIVDWDGFTVANGETVNFTFDTRSDIVLNRMVDSTPVQINGALNGYVGAVGGPIGGNVWFSAPGGVIFGASAVVNVGGLLATTAVTDPNNFLNAGSSFPSSTTSFPFTYPGTGYPGATGYPGGTFFPSGDTYPAGSAYPGITGYPVSNTVGGVGGVTVEGAGGGAPGAQINTHGGLLALIAPFVNVGAGASVAGGASVLYGGANDFTVSLTQESSGDLDLLQFVIDSPSQVADYPMVLQGSTSGQNVYLASLSASGIAGAVINAPGAITATQASPGVGGEIILTSSSDTLTPGQAAAATATAAAPVDLDLGPVTADGNLQVLSAGSIGLGGSVAAGGNVAATSTTTDGFGDTFGLGGVTAGSVTAGGSITLAGAEVYAATLTAGGTVSAAAYDRSDYANAGSAAVDIGQVDAGGDIALSAGDGYAALSGVSFTGPNGGAGQTLSLSGAPLYLGYAQAAQGSGTQGQGGAVGAIVGGGAVNLSSEGAVNVDLTGAATLGQVTAYGQADLTAASLTAASVFGESGVTATATTGDLDIAALDSGFGVVRATATLGNATVGTADAADIYVSAAKAASVTSATSFAPTSDPIQVTGASVFLGTANSVDDVIAEASAGSATVGDVTAGGDVTVSAAGGTASLHSASLSGTAEDGSAVSVTATGTGGDAVLGGTDGMGVVGFVAGAAPITIAASRDVTVDVAQPIELSTVQAGRNASLTAPGLTLDALGGTLTGTLAITVGDAAFAFSPAISAGGVSIDASGALTLGDVTAQTGALSLTGAGVNGGALSAGTAVTVQAGAGPVSLASAMSAGDTAIEGATVNVGPVTAGGAATLTADAGLLSVTGAVAANGGDASLAGLGVTAANISASGGVRVAGGPDPLSLGDVTAASGAVALTGAGVNGGALSAGTAVTVQAGAGPASLASAMSGEDTAIEGATVGVGPVTAGGSVTLTADAGLLSVTGAVAANGGDASLTGLGVTAANISASGAVRVAGGSDPLSLGDVSAASGAVTLTGAGVNGGALNAGTAVNVQAGAGPVSLTSVMSAGDTAIEGATVGVGPVTAGGAATLTADAGLLNVTGAVAANGGDASLTGVGVGASGVSASGDLSVNGGAGAVTLGAVSAGGAAQVSGAGVAIGSATAQGDLAVASTAVASASSLLAGGSLSVSAGGLASLGQASAGGTARIVAADLDLATGLSAPVVDIEALDGAFQLGGATAPATAALWLSDAEFGRITASTALNLYAGSTTGTARGDFSVLDLTVDPTRTPALNLYAAPGQTVSVSGTVAPTASGGALAIGGDAASGWRPSTILLSGALGAATRVSDTQFTDVRAFGSVSLDAGGDVLIGSPRFIALVQGAPAAAIDIARDKPDGVAAQGEEVGKVFVAAGRLAVAAAGRVVQQNTSGAPAAYAGLYLTNTQGAPGPTIVLDPPSLVDLFGSYVDAQGRLASGPYAARDGGLQTVGLAPGAPVLTDYRFNGCALDLTVACGGAVVGPEQGFDPTQEFQTESAVAQADSTTRPDSLALSVLLAIAPVVQSEEEESDPVVTGAGNEEIWRNRAGDR